MNKFKKILLTTVFAVTALSVTSLAACDKDKDSKKFALSFETNGAASIAQETKEEGSKYTLPTPSRDGYEFEGWYTDPSFSGSPVTEITVSADVKFYAKWAKLLTLTLDANGGTVNTTTLTVKEGASIYDAVKNIVPEKAGLTFGAWFIGDNEVTSSTLMAADTTLTARYKVAYTVEIYVQKADKSGYELEETKSGSGYVGSAYSASVTKEGYEEVANDNAKTEGNLSENASENVFRHYFDRLSINLTFKVSYPDGTTSEDFVLSDVAAGTEVEVPSDYKADGYVLAGWFTQTISTIAFTTRPTPTLKTRSTPLQAKPTTQSGKKRTPICSAAQTTFISLPSRRACSSKETACSTVPNIPQRTALSRLFTQPKTPLC